MYSNSKYNDNLNEYTQDIIDLFYPIGRGFIDFTDADYSNYLGCTWERELVGLTPIGYDPNDSDFNQIGKTLGEKTHKLTIYEMPNHNHSTPTTLRYESTSSWWIGGTGGTTIAADNKATGSTGGSQAHNNIQPSKIVAYWKRIA